MNLPGDSLTCWDQEEMSHREDTSECGDALGCFFADDKGNHDEDGWK